MEEILAETTEQNTRSSRSFWGWLIIWVGVIALLVILAIGLKNSTNQPVGKGDIAPLFTLETFEGQRISLESLKGNIVVVNFWASWCKPCEQEAADLQTAWERYEPRGDVFFLGLDYVDTRPEALAYLEKFQITYPNGPDLGQQIYDDFHATGVPETYFIDREGKLFHTRIGPFTSLSEITGVIDTMLEQ